MAGALDGIRVLDFTQLVQGSLASQMLGDLGAEIVKVERIGGEWMRHWTVYNHYLDGGNGAGKEGVAFLAYNRNKRSVALDLKRPEAKKILYALGKKSDVVMENFRPGVLDRMGYGYRHFRRLNPKVIYASATGFGADGPYAGRPGQDLLLQGLSGLMHLTGKAGDPPTACGVGIGDLYGASQLAYGILGALVHRERTGRGQRVESSILGSLLALQLQEIVYYLNSGQKPRRARTNMGHTGPAAPFGIYPTKDGFLALAMTPLPKLAGILNEPWLADCRDEAEAMARRDEIKERLDGVFARRTTSEWLQALDAHDVWCARVNDYAGVAEDPQVRHNRSFIDCAMRGGRRFRTVASPVRMSRTPPAIRRGVPGPGEHTAEVLRKLGYKRNEIDALRKSGVIR